MQVSNLNRQEHKLNTTYWYIKNAQKHDRRSEEGYEWLVVVADRWLWVCMGAYVYIGVGEHEK